MVHIKKFKKIPVNYVTELIMKFKKNLYLQYSVCDMRRIKIFFFLSNITLAFSQKSIYFV